MPLYTYACPDHGEFMALQRMKDRADSVRCPDCDKPCPRTGDIERPGLLKPGGEYQMGIVGPGGQVVPGHFGKEARRRRTRR